MFHQILDLELNICPEGGTIAQGVWEERDFLCSSAYVGRGKFCLPNC